MPTGKKIENKPREEKDIFFSSKDEYVLGCKHAFGFDFKLKVLDDGQHSQWSDEYEKFKYCPYCGENFKELK